MPQDPNLYGQRPAKKQKRDGPLLSSLDFTAQLTSLMAREKPATASSGRTRPSRESKEDIFKDNKTKRLGRDSKGGSKLALKDVAGTEEESQELARARRRMDDKARIYAAMKRGDYVPKENEAAPLVDFDKKWAENAEGRDGSICSSSDDDNNEGSGDGNEIIEYEDEFGRVRSGTRADKERMERRAKRGLLGAEELERMSARPHAPHNLIHGDTIQSLAFNPDDVEKMEELARKRDRSATPPELKHYDADGEIRSKGVGFYKFSKDEETRGAEMAALEVERVRTEALRKSREEEKDKRRGQMEQRRREMAARRAKKQAASFLDDLAGNVA